jgi:hypothetical protein
MSTGENYSALGARKEGGAVAQGSCVSKEGRRGRAVMEAARSYDARERRCRLEWNPNQLPLMVSARLCPPPLSQDN